MAYKTKFIFCPPNRGASRATKAAVFYSCNLFIWYLVGPLIIVTLRNLHALQSNCTWKFIQSHAVNKRGALGLSFVDFLPLQVCKTEEYFYWRRFNRYASVPLAVTGWSRVELFETLQMCWVDLMVKFKFSACCVLKKKPCVLELGLSVKSFWL